MISYALCRDLPQSFSSCVTAIDLNQSPIDINLAHKQHDAYVQVLKEHVTNLIQVSADEAHPGNRGHHRYSNWPSWTHTKYFTALDCCFVEDTCVVVKDTVVVNQLGHVSRQKEIGPIAKALQQVRAISVTFGRDGQDTVQSYILYIYEGT
jgi:dimethylargininase